MTCRPVHDRNQIQEAALYRDVGDVGAPDSVGRIDHHSSEKVGINPMCGMGIAGSRRLIDRLQSHQSHQTPHPVTAHRDALAQQLADHLTRTVKRILHEQLIDAPHQRQVFHALAPIGTMTGRVMERRPADRKQAALTAQAQAEGVALDYRLALPPALRLSPLARKSRSTVN